MRSSQPHQGQEPRKGQVTTATYSNRPDDLSGPDSFEQHSEETGGLPLSSPRPPAPRSVPTELKGPRKRGTDVSMGSSVRAWPLIGSSL